VRWGRLRWNQFATIAFVKAGSWYHGVSMASIYDMFAAECSRIAARTKVKSDKADLLRLADQWKVVAAEQNGEVGKSAHRPTRALHAPERR
jgi:hypothetical protein